VEQEIGFLVDTLINLPPTSRCPPLVVCAPCDPCNYVVKFIHSGYFYSTCSSPLLLRGAPDSTDNVLEFDAEAPQATVSEGLTQGPYWLARAGFEPTTLQTKGVESTNAPPRPILMESFSVSDLVSFVVGSCKCNLIFTKCHFN